jgi:hypothetical protein
MSLNITSRISGSSKDTGELYSLSKFVPILTFFKEMSSIGIDDIFKLISLVLKEPSILTSEYNYSNSSNKVNSYLEDSNSLKKVETNGLIIHIAKGIIYDAQKNILLCLTVETQYIIDCINSIEDFDYTRFSEYSNTFIGYEPFVMFVSTEFANNKEYSVLYRRIKKIYLDFCFEKGIEMRLISSSKIKENTFTNNLKIEFNSLTELNHHLTQDVKYLLQTPLENFKENDYPLLLGNPPISESKVESTLERGTRIHQEVEKVISNHFRDSMLEDSDADEREFEQQIVNINLENTPSQTLSEMMDRLNSQPVSWEEPINSDRSIAAGLALMSLQRHENFTRHSLNDGIYIATQYLDVADAVSSSVFPREALLQQLDEFPDASIDDVEEEQEDLSY